MPLHLAPELVGGHKAPRAGRNNLSAALQERATDFLFLGFPSRTIHQQCVGRDVGQPVPDFILH